MSNIHDWSVTPIDNANADALITLVEGMLPGLMNDATRGVMARIKEKVLDLGGGLVTGGTANVMTVTPASNITSLFDGFALAARSSTTNTGAATLNVNALGGKPVKVLDPVQGEVDIKAGQIRAGGIYVFAYSSVANSGNGAWILLNPTAAGSSRATYHHLVASNNLTEFAYNAWTPWPLSVEVSDPSDLATLSGNVLTLARACYVSWSGYARISVGGGSPEAVIVTSRCYNVTDSAEVRLGTMVGSGSNSGSGTLPMSGMTEGGPELVAAGKNIRFDYYAYRSGVGSVYFGGWSSAGTDTIPNLGNIPSLRVKLEAS